MPMPDFSDDENYLINCAKSPDVSKSSSSYTWGYLIASAGLAGVAIYENNFWLLFSAFVMVCGFRIYEERFQAKWLPHWKSIINKFEEACTSEPDGDNS